MKRPMLLIPFAALAFAAVLGGPKAMPAYAEGEEPIETSIAEASSEEVVSEETVSEESVESAAESSKKFDVNSIVIDGKTVEEWKRDLKDESTRNAIIMSFALSALPTFLFVIKWLTDRDLIGKAKKIVANTSAQLDALQAKADEQEAKFNEKIAALENHQQAFEEHAKKVIENGERTGDMLELVMKTDPKLVAADAYAKAKRQVEEKYGKGK